MTRHILIAGTLALISTGASALEINVTPGSLKENQTAVRTTRDDRLTLKGTADVRDLVLLQGLAPSVTMVDMTMLQVSAYTYPEGESYAGRTSYAANEIPPYMLIGTNVSICRLPASVTTIGDGAFASTKVRTLVIPPSVTRIGDMAWSDCDLLQKVRFPNDAELSKGVFKDCDALTLVEYDYDVTEIPEAMFDGCDKFCQSIPVSVTKIGRSAFRGTAFEELDLSSVSEIGAYAFADMPNLMSVTISTNHDVNIGTGAFFNDGALAYVPLGDNNVPVLALAHTAAGKVSVNTPTIGEAAFANDTRTDTLTLGPAVSSIGAHAFRNMKSLTIIDAERHSAPIDDVDATAFSGLENPEGRYDIKLSVMKGTNDAWKAHPVWGLFTIGQFDVSVGDIIAEGADISVRRIGGEISVTSTQPVDYVGVFSADGMVMTEARPGTETCTLSDGDTAQVVVVKVISGGVTKVVKLK